MVEETNLSIIYRCAKGCCKLYQHKGLTDYNEGLAIKANQIDNIHLEYNNKICDLQCKMMKIYKQVEDYNSITFFCTIIMNLIFFHINFYAGFIFFVWSILMFIYNRIISKNKKLQEFEYKRNEINRINKILDAKILEIENIT